MSMRLLALAQHWELLKRATIDLCCAPLCVSGASTVVGGAGR